MWLAASQMEACLASEASTPPKSPVIGVLILVQWAPRSVVSRSVPAFPASQQTREEGAKPAVRFAFAPVSNDFHFLPPSVVNCTVPAGCSFQKTLLSGVSNKPVSEPVTSTASLETPCFLDMALVCMFGAVAFDSIGTDSVIERGTLFASAWAGRPPPTAPPTAPLETGGGGAGGAEATARAFSEAAASVAARAVIPGAGEGGADFFFSKRPLAI